MGGPGSRFGEDSARAAARPRLPHVSAPSSSPATVVVIGNFDGVHLGHREVITRARGLDPDLPVIVVTFWPHPLSVLTPETAPLLLCTLPRRIELLKEAGADEVRVVRFTRELAAWRPAAFVENVLAPLNPRHVAVGRNFRFGARAAGTPEMMAELGRPAFDVTAVQLIGADGVKTSSTLVRQCVAEGDMERAAAHLGRHFDVEGVVVMGDQRGRELGFPTANLVLPPTYAVPDDGVYAGWLVASSGPLAGQRLPAAISVGSNPTFDGVERRVETHVLDRSDLELYGVGIRVEFVSRLRGQVKFEGIEPLITQMDADVARCRELLGVDDPAR